MEGNRFGGSQKIQIYKIVRLFFAKFVDKERLMKRQVRKLSEQR